MGTRSVIAKPHGDGFMGKYCHWDGYPSGVGAALWAEPTASQAFQVLWDTGTNTVSGL